MTHRDPGPDTATVSVAYDLPADGEAILGRTATAVLPHGPLIIVDNGPPGSLPKNFGARLQREATTGITIRPYEGNRGFGAGCNAGAALALDARFVLFVNPDAEVTTAMVSTLLASFAAHPNLGIASPQLVDHAGVPVETGGAFPTIAGLVLGKFRQNDTFRPRHDAINASRANHPFIPADWVSGAVMMCRREVWEATGGFDPAYFMYYEDIDLCRRARQAGWEVGIVPEAVAVHESGGSQWRPGTRSRIERIYFESQAYYFRKHHGRLAELFLRIVRFPYLATGLRRQYLERYGVRIRTEPDPL